MTVFVVCLTVIIMSGCTRHNGDIGDLFGEWRTTYGRRSGNGAI